VANSILALQPPHPQHGTALRLCSAKSELLEHTGKLQQAIHSQQLWVDCRRQLHGDHCCDQRTGFGCERLGDLLEKENDMLACERAHQKAVQALQMCRGNSSDPLTMCAMKKLTTVQMQIQKSAGNKALLSRSTGPICALCGIQDPNHKKCTRCKVGCCCNRDHQTVHWKVHKKTCCSGQQRVHMPSPPALQASHLGVNAMPHPTLDLLCLPQLLC